jgi:UPF0716 family protein affecting phage T7 exclusion
MIFKIILLFILAVMFVPPFRKFLFWLLVGRKIAEHQKRAEAFFKQQQGKEGDINIRYNPKEDSKGRKDDGEYIDFQEIK